MAKKQLEKESEEKIMQLQILQQNLTNLNAQKQQFQNQLIEIESALKELKGTKKCYKIIGNIMVASENKDLTKEIEQKKEIAELRISNFEKQEKALKENATMIQKEIMAKIKQ